MHTFKERLVKKIFFELILHDRIKECSIYRLLKDIAYFFTSRFSIEQGVTMMKRDTALLNETTSMVKDFAGSSLYNLPLSSFQKIAQDMLHNGKMGNGSWIAKSLLKEKNRLEKSRLNSHKFGYNPFTNIGFFTYRWIKEQYAGWVLPLMAIKLEKPEDIYAAWGVQFADAMDALGKKACEESHNLYKFVTDSKEWSDATIARQDYLKDFKSHKKKYKYRKSLQKNSKQRSFTNSLFKKPRVFTGKNFNYHSKKSVSYRQGTNGLTMQ